MRSHFRTFPLLYADKKASTMRSSAIIVLDFFESSDGGVTKAVDKRPHYLRCPLSEVILYWLRYVGD